MTRLANGSVSQVASFSLDVVLVLWGIRAAGQCREAAREMRTATRIRSSGRRKHPHIVRSNLRRTLLPRFPSL